MKLLPLGLLVGALGQDDEAVDPRVKINAIWTPPVCERKVHKGDFVRYHYSGFLTDGTVFDTSYMRGGTYNTYVGSGWLIPGMDQALYGMCVRERRIVQIPADLAYGEEGVDGIPGGADILFTVELDDIWNPSDQVAVKTLEASDCEFGKVFKKDFVRYHYNGTLPNGKPFHSSYEEGRTYDTYVGKGWLIKGMDEGLIGMCPGERRRITIPPHLAYGERGDGNNIPGHSTIIFDVSLVDRFDPEDGPEVRITHEVENCARKTESGDFVRYTGKGSLMDGTVFWETAEGDTYNTYLGHRSLIAGMEKGLAGMCTGEKRRVIIPPSWGYGEKGSSSGKVPGSAVLIFDVELKDFHNPNDVPKMTTIVEPPEECKKLKENQIIMLDYHAELEDGTIIDSFKDLKLEINGKRLIYGLFSTFTEMCVDGSYHLHIPPHFGYGEKGVDGYIPGSAVLLVKVAPKHVWDPMDERQVAECEDGTPSFTLCDVNEDESVDFQEFSDCFSTCRIQGEPMRTHEDAETDAFQRLDGDDSFTLTEAEFSTVFPEEDHDEL